MKRTLKIFNKYKYGQGTRKSFIFHFFRFKFQNRWPHYYEVLTSDGEFLSKNVVMHAGLCLHVHSYLQLITW